MINERQMRALNKLFIERYNEYNTTYGISALGFIEMHALFGLSTAMLDQKTLEFEAKSKIFKEWCEIYDKLQEDYKAPNYLIDPVDFNDLMNVVLSDPIRRRKFYLDIVKCGGMNR